MSTRSKTKTQEKLASENTVSKRKGEDEKGKIPNKKVKHQKCEEKKDTPKNVQSTTLEEAKQKAAEEKEKKQLERLLKKQELETKKLERERDMKLRKLQKEIENKAKEERKKERERLRLEKKEQAEKQKQIRQIEKEERKLKKQMVLELNAKYEKERLMQEAEVEKAAEPEKKSDFHNTGEADFDNKNDYEAMLAALDTNLVSNAESFECPICFMNIESGEGVILHDCLHSFCKECLAASIQHSETTLIRCPFQNDEYACESHLQDREIKYLVTAEIYEKHLQRSLMLAESQAPNSFHCKSSDCPGWCLYEDNVNNFWCSTCAKNNCLTCAAIHEGQNCKQYQDYVLFNSYTNEEAKITQQYLQNMLQKQNAMNCPKCQIIIIKKDGCDAITCSMCQTEICWVTKGPRWGPKGKGDITGGCRCNYEGKRCHPNCRNCH